MTMESCEILYTKILVPLDGSAVAEQALPYVRTLAGGLEVPIESVGVVDMEELASHAFAEKGRYVEPMIEDSLRRSAEYLKGVAHTFPYPNVSFSVGKGRAAEVIIAKAVDENKKFINLTSYDG